MGNRCPFCGSTDIAELADENKATCLDCEKTWVPGGRRNQTRTRTARRRRRGGR